uniref:Uncharacterized protein n=1 Tax=Klebsiella oxytoca TaxID=571 RepID=A0A1Z3MMF0_KLEOX|nr:hypothetical protein [Klebsiella oxytoca]
MVFVAGFVESFLHQASFATGYWCYELLTLRAEVYRNAEVILHGISL